MSIDQKTVKYISKLARISINEKKAKNLANDLTNIFKFIEKLNKLDTKNIEPLTSIAETKLHLREDNIKDIEHNEDNFERYSFLLKLFDKADIINQINFDKLN